MVRRPLRRAVKDSLKNSRALAMGIELLTPTSPGRFQFRLRTLFIATLLVAIPLTIYVAWRRAVNAPPLDFKSLLISLDGAIGKRFQSMQMDAMESVTYQYDGPMQTVLDIVAPVARKSGFFETDINQASGSGAAQQETLKKAGV